MLCRMFISLLLLVPLTGEIQADVPVTFLRTMAPPERDVEGLETEFVSVRVDAGKTVGPLPPLQGDLSQGAETGDPSFYEEMEHRLTELKPRLVRVSPFANIFGPMGSPGQAISLNDDGTLKIDFSDGDRIIHSLRRAGAKICWNCASWPKDWRSEKGDGYPKDLKIWASFIRQVVQRYNTGDKRLIDYIEFWNEPASFNAKAYDVLAKTALDVDPGVKVGAPATMDLKLSAVEAAVKHSHETGTPLHFISYHLYYKPPWEWPEIIAKAQAVLDKYPGMEKTEMLVTEWGIDAGESGSCDTRFNAAYYCAVLERLIPYYPQVRPTHFELREGWDWKGPSRDLFGRWGMLTYTNMLPKPVFQAARMWARMAPNQLECSSSDERIRTLASVGPEKLTILVWSYPRKFQRMQANAPEHGPSVMDIPVTIDVKGLRFRSAGLSYERYALDYLHSNITTDLGRSELEKVQGVILAREAVAKSSADSDFRVQTVMPLHGVSLIVLRPAERAPADVEAIPDRYQIWAGQSAGIEIRPQFGEDFPLELLPDRGSPDQWRTEIVSQQPLRIRVTPLLPDIRAQQFYTAWVKRTDWGALGRVLCEFRTDIPVRAESASWRMDVDAQTRSGKVVIPLRGLANTAIQVKSRWSSKRLLRIDPIVDQVAVAPDGVANLSANVSLPKDARPGKYSLVTVPNTGVDLNPIETTVYLPMQSHRTRTELSLDGQLDEWQDIEPIVLNSKASWGGHHTARWGGPDDLSGTIRSMWDKTNLYFAFEVTDDHHITHFFGRDMSKYDLIHIGFDLRRDCLDKNAFFIEDDCDYGIAFTDRGGAYRFWGAKRREEIPKEMVIGVVQKGHVTTYEVAFPWKAEFEPYATPEAGRVMGVSIELCDIDPDEGQGFLRWGEGLVWHTKRPALFNSLQLVK